MQLFLHLVHQVERILALAVHLVHEHHHRGLPHPADFHQPPCLRLHTLRAVDHHNRAIHRRQCAECIFREILVTRGVKDIDMVGNILLCIAGSGATPVIESHHRGCHRDSPLFLYLHPVRGGRLADLIALHRTCHMDSTAVQQQFLGQRRLTCIRVGDDGERPSSQYLVLISGT